MANDTATSSSGPVVFDAETVGIKKRLAQVLNTCTEGGETPFHLVLSNTTNSTVVKSTKGQLYRITGFNKSAGAVPFHLKIYDKATAANPASDVPKIVYTFPPDLSTPPLIVPHGVAFANGIAILVTLGIADTDNTSIAAAGDGVIGIGYM